MRILKYILPIMALLLMIPLASAQEESEAVTLTLTEDTRFEDLFAEYGCPVGIRDANRNLVLNSDGLIVAGQTVFIPSDSALCEIDYSGAIAFFEMADYDAEGYTEDHPYYLPAQEFAASNNVCEADLYTLNPEWLQVWGNDTWRSFSYGPNTKDWPQYIRIPLDTPACFETVELEAGEQPRDLAYELNLCEQIIWYYNVESIYKASDENRLIYIPLERQPCYQDGQLLKYEGAANRFGDYVPVVVVSLEEASSSFRYAIDNGYCADELRTYNRHENLSALRAGDKLYIPEGARRCQYVSGREMSLVELAREYNVCLEEIISLNEGVNSWSQLDANQFLGIFIPTDRPACYAENGLRIGHNDRAVHETTPEDWLFGIAQHYQVCMADLFAANSLLNNYPITDLPSIVFIPDTAPCSDVDEEGFVHHVVREPDTAPYNSSIYNYYSLAYVYNVCPDTVFEANPQMILDVQNKFMPGWYNVYDDANNPIAYNMKRPEVGDIVNIPISRYPCYDFNTPLQGVGHYRGVGEKRDRGISYVCYSEEVDPHQDYTGHEPAISPVPMRESSYCYDKAANPYIVLNNITYTLYPISGDAYIWDVADCFGVNPYTIVNITYGDLGFETNYSDYPWYWGIPNPTQDCPLIGNDTEAAMNWLRQREQQRVYGTFNEEGAYGVQEGDTLSGIGRRFGYLPEWIMAENGMTSASVYVNQTLKLPGYPNYYQIATYGGATLAGLLVLFGGTFTLRLRARLRREKKKNAE